MTCVLSNNLESMKVLNGLHSNENFDNVKPLNGKPSAKAEGLTIAKTSDSLQANVEDGDLNTPILAQPPNLYKQTGAFVSNIPYNFRPIPDEFLTDDFIDDPVMMRFIRWMFKRISTKPSSVPLKNKRKSVELEPFEFMYGRKKCAEQAGITMKQAESRIGQLVGMNYVTKVGIKSGSTFSIYRLVTGTFSQNSGQHVGQQVGQHVGQHVGHNQDQRGKRKEKDKEDHPSIPSFPPDRSIDDLFSKENKILVHSGKYANGNPFHVHLTQEELDRCIQSKGSIERVKDAINQLASWPNRKYEIKEWANTIIKWNFKNVIGDRIADNEKLGKQIQDLYGECQGWSARVYRDPLKDCRGVLFESSASVGNPIPIFIPFTEATFKEKCLEVIKAKNMQKKGKK